MKKLSCSILLLTLLITFGCNRPFDTPSKDATLQPSFSQDTLRIDTLYSRLSSATHRLILYNRHEKAIELTKISLDGEGSPHFRLNVDGRSGREFSEILIPARDSLFLFVEATFPEGADDLPTRYEASLLFHCRDVVSKVLLEGVRLNIDHCETLFINRDSTLAGNRPLLVKDSIVVNKGATLTLEPGVHLLMGDKGKIVVYGSLRSIGDVANRVLIEGVRRDELIEKVNYRLLPGQWEDIEFKEGCGNIYLKNTTIRNGRGGIVLGTEEANESIDIELEECIVTNMKGNAIRGVGAKVKATNCLFSNTMASLIELRGGSCSLSYCTVASFYPFDRRLGPAISLSKTKQGQNPSLQLSHSIVEGSFGTSRPEHKKPSGGEILFDNEHQEWIKIYSSYLRSPLEVYSNVEDCLEASLPPDSIFVSLGRDKKTKEYTFIYDFRPFDDAPFVSKEGNNPSKGVAPSLDLEGKERKTPATWGAYEAIERKTKEENAETQK